MTKNLTPNVAADFANAIYSYNSVISASAFKFDKSLSDFQLTNDVAFKGTTGAYFFRKETGFAITAVGKTPQYKDHHIIAIRGTSQLVDWVTNAYISPGTSSSGKTAHEGFLKSFESLKPSFARYIREHKPSHVHCVGHSLGGALATLTADWLQSEMGVPVTVYTFGAPRVGLLCFAKHCSMHLNIHRCIHGNDVVPCIPVWPFVHGGKELRLTDNVGLPLSKAAHSMFAEPPGYVNTASAYASYQEMAACLRMNNRQGDVVLEYQRKHEARFNAQWERTIAQALDTLIRKSGLLGAMSVQYIALSSPATFYDLLARSLDQIAKTSTTFYNDLKGILGHMLVFVGRVSEEVTTITYAVIRNIFNLMLSRLYKLAKQAMGK